MTTEQIRAALDAGHLAEVVIFCDRCGTEHRGDYIGESSTARFRVARINLVENHGWQCDDEDVCPGCLTGTPTDGRPSVAQVLLDQLAEAKQERDAARAEVDRLRADNQRLRDGIDEIADRREADARVYQATGEAEQAGYHRGMATELRRLAKDRSGSDTAGAPSEEQRLRAAVREMADKLGTQAVICNLAGNHDASRALAALHDRLYALLNGDGTGTLWAVHHRGSDEYYAQPSRAEAERMKAWLDGYDAARHGDPYAALHKALVVEWPLSAEQHAAQLAEAVAL